MKTLVIGDVHGHLDRLEALLKQEGIIGECPICHGTGDYQRPSATEPGMCLKCNGVGISRINHDVEVVQLGDLGHYGIDTVTADRLTWEYAPKWIDVILWGNHDRAVIEKGHHFGGYANPDGQTKDAIDAAITEGKLKLAYEAHGFLLTHAGLHSEFQHNKIPSLLKTSPKLFAEWLNECDIRGADDPPPEYTNDFRAIRDNISPLRGAHFRADGGILWRDAREPLYDGFKQVFGHTSRDEDVTRTYPADDGLSYCIDVGNQYNGRLKGLWLPEERVVEIHLKEDQR